MKQARTLDALTAEVMRQAHSKRDFVLNTEAITIHDEPTVNDEPFVHFKTATNADVVLEPGEYAREQMSAHYKVPQKYEEMLWTNHPTLWAKTFNHFLHSASERRMIRTMDGRFRAFLSDRYRPLDNWDLLQAAVPILDHAGCRIEQSDVTERKLYIKAVTEAVQQAVVGDIVQAGVMISNSEVGKGALCIQPLLFTLSCSNGMVVNKLAHRKAHLGGRLLNDGDDDSLAQEYFTDATRKQDDRAYWMKFADTVRWALDEATFRQCMQVVNKAAITGIESESETRQQTVELVAKRYAFNDTELQAMLLAYDNEPRTLYGLANSVTRIAQDVERYDRSVELESIGWQIMSGDRQN